MKSCPTCKATYPAQYALCPTDGSALVDASTWSPGMVINGKYKLLEKLGQGGMGSVFKAEHMKFQEPRALKVMNPELAHDRGLAERFTNEAIITRRLQHPNAVRVDDIDASDDGRPFIVMEFIQGRSLKDVVHGEGALPIARACHLVRQVAAALEAAHELGLVHRDIKPDNILLVDTPTGEQAKVLDFGIARVRDARLSGGHTMTATGTVVGTPAYMSPEQVQGKHGDEIDGRSDLYSLGIVFYELLSGAVPFSDDSTMAVMMAHLHQQPPPLRPSPVNPAIPAPIAALINRCLEKDPAHRPPTARALIQEIDRAEAGTPNRPMASPPTMVLSAAAIASAQRVQVTPPPAMPAPVMTPSVTPPPARPGPATVVWRAPAPRPAALPPSAPSASKRFGPGLAAGAAAVLLVGGGLWWELAHHSPPTPASPAAQTTAIAPTNQPVSPPVVQPTAPPASTQPPKQIATSSSKQAPPAPVHVSRSTSLATLIRRSAKAVNNAVTDANAAQNGNDNPPSQAATSNSAASLDQAGQAAVNRGDYNTAFQDFSQAAQSSDPQAERALGFLYLDGKGTSPNPSQAVNYFKLAADQNDQTAQYELGYCYQFGQGVAANPQQAIYWYQKSTINGNVAAQYALGTVYQQQQDYSKAAGYYRMAAARGYGPARAALQKLQAAGVIQ